VLLAKLWHGVSYKLSRRNLPNPVWERRVHRVEAAPVTGGTVDHVDGRLGLGVVVLLHGSILPHGESAGQDVASGQHCERVRRTCAPA
jgi:hypothetical protein